MKRPASDINRARSTDPDRTALSLLTRPEVAAIYGVSRRFLELAPARGEGPPFVRIGRSVRYRPEDVERWIAAQIVDPAEGRR